jgi:hypothetical protein
MFRLLWDKDRRDSAFACERTAGLPYRPRGDLAIPVAGWLTFWCIGARLNLHAQYGRFNQYGQFDHYGRFDLVWLSVALGSVARCLTETPRTFRGPAGVFGVMTLGMKMSLTARHSAGRLAYFGHCETSFGSPSFSAPCRASGLNRS